jgi:hypothetical protein
MVYDRTMDPEAVEVAASINRLVDEYRTRCLWFLRPDYYPATHEEQLRVLGYVERYGDVAAYRRAARLRQWLLHPSKAASADS